MRRKRRRHRRLRPLRRLQRPHAQPDENPGRAVLQLRAHLCRLPGEEIGRGAVRRVMAHRAMTIETGKTGAGAGSFGTDRPFQRRRRQALVLGAAPASGLHAERPQQRRHRERATERLGRERAVPPVAGLCLEPAHRRSQHRKILAHRHSRFARAVGVPLQFQAVDSIAVGSAHAQRATLQRELRLACTASFPQRAAGDVGRLERAGCADRQALQAAAGERSAARVQPAPQPHGVGGLLTTKAQARSVPCSALAFKSAARAQTAHRRVRREPLELAVQQQHVRFGQELGQPAHQPLQVVGIRRLPSFQRGSRQERVELRRNIRSRARKVRRQMLRGIPVGQVGVGYPQPVGPQRPPARDEHG